MRVGRTIHGRQFLLGLEESHNENRVSRDGATGRNGGRRSRKREKLGNLRLSILSISLSASQVMDKGCMLRTSQPAIEDLQQWRQLARQKRRAMDPEAGEDAGSVNPFRVGNDPAF